MSLTTPEPFSHWEDYANGLYSRRPIDPENVGFSAALLSDPEQFLEVAGEMIREWPVAAHHNLVEMNAHRRSWTGQASCCYAHGATAAETVLAWGRLSNATQDQANAVADIAINAFLGGGARAGEQTLFDY